MSTRCNVIIRDDENYQIFYRHSDGYPEGVAPTLDKFVEWVKQGKIRDNVEQSAGWLLILGALELNGNRYALPNELGEQMKVRMPNEDFLGWKASHYEPSNRLLHARHLYLLDITVPEWKEIPAVNEIEQVQALREWIF